MKSRRSKHGRRQRQKKKSFVRVVGVLLSILAICLACFLFINRASLIGKEKQATNITSSQTSSSVSTSSTTETSNSTSETSTEIAWEKQAEPVKVPILMYHAIHVMAPEESANANLIIDPTTFESQLQALQNAGYYTLTP